MISKGGFLACFAMVLVLDCVSAMNQRHFGGRTYPYGRFRGVQHLPFKKIIYVSNSNSGEANFSSIQLAIDSVPNNNQEWVCIYIKAGTYKEQVTIPYYKPYIYLHGEGRKKTHIVYGDHGSILKSPTFISQADNVVAKSITFQNSYNNPMGSNPIETAVAAYIGGDKSAFYRCRFLGFQDTLWDDKGRHYFKLCTIQGAVDFIFGSGQSIYESCTISVVAGQLNGAGYITAQGRASPKDTNGFVFKYCNVNGTGIAYLGRPWRPYATVIFYNSSLAKVVHPEGWNPWDSRPGTEYHLTYVEKNCYGDGANISHRVKWEAKLKDDVLNWYTSMSYIDTEGWIRKQPFYMLN